MHGRSPAAFVAAMLLLLLAVHVAVASQDLGTLARNGFLYDDSFYAFKIAQNIAAGSGSTFDGIHPTNGFQPLYVFLLVPVYLLAGNDLVLPIYVALAMLAVFTSLTALFVYRISRRYVGAAASLAAALVWGLSPIVIKQSANGLETAVAAFMIALSVWFYIERVRPAERPTAGRYLALGSLLGLTVLARIDGGLLVLVILLDQLVLFRRRRIGARRAYSLLFVPLGVMLCYGPWLAYSIVECGSPLQDSGAATRFLSLAYTSYFHQGPESLAMTGPDGAFVLKHVTHAVSVLKVIPPVHVLFRSIDRLGASLGAGGFFHGAGNVFGALVLLGAGAAIARWRRDERRSRRRELDFLLLYSVLLVAAYATYIFGVFYFLRYFYPVYLVACLYGAFLLQDLFDLVRERRASFRRFLVVAGAVYATLFLFFSFSQAFRSHPVYPFYDLSRWVDEHTTRNETIGVFQCGTIGYLSGRTTINLDGKVNRDAYAALREGHLGRYIREEGIDVVLDHRRIVELFLGYTPERMKGACTPVDGEGDGHPCGWVAYRPFSGARTAGGGHPPGATTATDAFAPAD